MSQTISTRCILGNFILEKVRKNKFTFYIDEIYKFDTAIEYDLKILGAHSSLNNKDLLNEIYNCPFIERIHTMDSLSMNEMYVIDKSSKIETLERYYRYGIPKWLSRIFSEYFN